MTDPVSGNFASYEMPRYCAREPDAKRYCVHHTKAPSATASRERDGGEEAYVNVETFEAKDGLLLAVNRVDKERREGLDELVFLLRQLCFLSLGTS